MNTNRKSLKCYGGVGVKMKLHVLCCYKEVRHPNFGYNFRVYISRRDGVKLSEHTKIC